MALNSRIIGRKIAAAIESRYKKARPFWTEFFDQLIEHIHEYMDLVEVVRTFQVTDTTYAVPDEDVVLVVDTVEAGGPYTLTLPDEPFTGQYVTVKDGGGHAHPDSAIIIDRNDTLLDGDSVNGSLTVAYASQTYYYDGTQWLTLGGGGGGVSAGTVPTQEYFEVSGSGDTSHALSTTPTGLVRLYLNGQLCREGATHDFEVSGGTITVHRPLVAGDLLAAIYYPAS